MSQNYIKNNSRSDKEIVSVISGRQRLAKLLDVMTIISYLGMFVCPIFGLITWNNNHSTGIVLVALMVVFVFICAFLDKETKKLEIKIKELTGQYIIRDILAEKIDILEYFPTRYIDMNYAVNCSILPTFNKMYGSDYISGSYKGKKFIYCDLLLKLETTERDSNGRMQTHTATRFRGSFMGMELGKDVGEYLQIKERKNPRKNSIFFANTFGADVHCDSIETENIEFNNRFEIKTSSAQFAFYILTPQFMESIIRLDRLAGGYTNIEFCGKSVIITLNNNRDSFEIHRMLISQKRLKEARNTFRKELEIILGIFDELLTKEALFQ